jgi:hypothetical protein
MQTACLIFTNAFPTSPKGLSGSAETPAPGSATSKTKKSREGGEESLFSSLIGIANNQISSGSAVSSPLPLGKAQTPNIETHLKIPGNISEKIPLLSPEDGRPSVQTFSSRLPTHVKASDGDMLLTSPFGETKPPPSSELSAVQVKGGIHGNELPGKLNPGLQDTEKDINLLLRTSAEDSRAKTENTFNHFRDIVTKTMFVDKDASRSELLDIGSHEDENLRFHSNGQASGRTTDVFALTKETDTLEKPFETKTLTQLIEKAVLELKNGKPEIKIDLKPEFLGHLRLQISTENHQVMLKILTEAPIVKETLENNINHLKIALHNHGLEIDEFDVFLSQDSNRYGYGSRDTEFQKTESEPHDKRKLTALSADEYEETIQHEEVGKALTLVNLFI